MDRDSNSGSGDNNNANRPPAGPAGLQAVLAIMQGHMLRGDEGDLSHVRMPRLENYSSLEEYHVALLQLALAVELSDDDRNATTLHTIEDDWDYSDPMPNESNDDQSVPGSDITATDFDSVCDDDSIAGKVKDEETRAVAFALSHCNGAGNTSSSATTTQPVLQ